MFSLSEEMSELELSLTRLEKSIADLRAHTLTAPSTVPNTEDVQQGELFGIRWDEVPTYRRKSDGVEIG